MNSLNVFRLVFIVLFVFSFSLFINIIECLAETGIDNQESDFDGRIAISICDGYSDDWYHSRPTWNSCEPKFMLILNAEDIPVYEHASSKSGAELIRMINHSSRKDYYLTCKSDLERESNLITVSITGIDTTNDSGKRYPPTEKILYFELNSGEYTINVNYLDQSSIFNLSVNDSIYQFKPDELDSIFSSEEMSYRRFQKNTFVYTLVGYDPRTMKIYRESISNMLNIPIIEKYSLSFSYGQNPFNHDGKFSNSIMPLYFKYEDGVDLAEIVERVIEVHSNIDPDNPGVSPTRITSWKNEVFTIF